MNTSVVETTGNLTSDILSAVEPLGGLSAFVTQGDRVLIKPNFNTADPFPASTDNAFLESVVDLVLHQKPSKIIIGESSTMLLSTESIFNKIDPYTIAKKSSLIKIVNFENDTWTPVTLSEATYLKKVHVPRILDSVDTIITLPCLKTHSQAQFTGALKLAVGLMKPSQRVKMHMGHLQEKIAELNLTYLPNLILMDARKCFISGGPSHGALREPNRILAGDARVEMDIAGIRIIQSYEGNDLAGINPEELPQIAHAKKLGIA